MTRRRSRVVDLARERRIRAALNEVRSLTSLNVDRYRGALAGSLPIARPGSDTLEALVPDTASRPPAARLPADLLQRADDLVPLLAARPDLAGYGRVSRSAVVRIALARGLDALAAELAPKRGGA